MLLNKEYYYEMTRKYTAVILGLFKHVKHVKFNDEDDNFTFENTPVIYSHAEKYLKDIANKIKSDQSISRVLPVIAISLINIYPNPEIRRNPYNKFTKRCHETDTSVSTYPPIPYNFDFKVEIIAKKTGVGASITEQILPYFTPDFTISVKEIQDFNIINDVVVNLKNHSFNFDTEFTTNYDSTKYYLSSFDLTLKGNLYKPISDSGIIETVIMTVKNYRNEVNLDENDVLINMTITDDE